MAKTEKNLRTAFAGESMARNKYTFFAQVARKEGYRYIAKLFEETANDERRHAKDIFKLLGGFKDTVSNLKEAIEGENYEVEDMYAAFEKDAKEEGIREAEILFKTIAMVEEHHRNRYKRILEMVINESVYKRDEPIKWKCDVCGYIHTGKEPPGVCPCCKHAKEYFEPANMDL
jgi:rubrerythrin